MSSTVVVVVVVVVVLDVELDVDVDVSSVVVLDSCSVVEVVDDSLVDELASVVAVVEAALVAVVVSTEDDEVDCSLVESVVDEAWPAVGSDVPASTDGLAGSSPTSSSPVVASVLSPSRPKAQTAVPTTTTKARRPSRMGPSRNRSRSMKGAGGTVGGPSTGFGSGCAVSWRSVRGASPAAPAATVSGAGWWSVGSPPLGGWVAPAGCRLVTGAGNRAVPAPASTGGEKLADTEAAASLRARLNSLAVW